MTRMSVVVCFLFFLFLLCLQECVNLRHKLCRFQDIVINCNFNAFSVELKSNTPLSAAHTAQHNRNDKP
eukprot:m.99266 g.99266  ORF g.99266 m.99266 type:complete len:69 (+) comp27140_c1_seq3:314-520(+)